jgi:hypothetical protein
MFKLEILYYTRKKPVVELVEIDELGARVTELMLDGRVQFIFIRRDRQKGGDNKP